MNETKQITKAIIAVMQEVKGIEKNLQVGTGNGSYKGVADQEVKQIIGSSMAKHGLAILPIEISPTVKVERWEEESQFGKKMKQGVFTEVMTKYLLLHESGESIEISGYGHGVDSQDKAAGKATTYALKYALLYTFLVPTGKIDDADSEHSETAEVPQKTYQDDNKKWLNKWTSTKRDSTTKEWKNCIEKLMDGSITLAIVEANYKLSKEIRTELEQIANSVKQ